jgi:hypothetical protein
MIAIANDGNAAEPHAANSALHASRPDAQSNHGFRLEGGCRATVAPGG